MSTADEPVVTVVQNASEPQYDVVVEGEVAGFTVYQDRDDDVRAFVHTEIEDGREGQGLGGILVREALDAERAAGHRVVAECPFVKGWIERHPEYQDLLA